MYTGHKSISAIFAALLVLLSLSPAVCPRFVNASVGWSKTYGGTSSDTAYSLIQTNDNGYALVGETYSFGVPGTGFGLAYLVKTDEQGTMMWNKTYRGDLGGWASALIQASSGGYAIVGSTVRANGKEDVWLIRTDQDGNLQWNTTYGGVEADWGYSLVETVDGGYLLAGITTSYGAGWMDAWLIRTDSLGNPVWNKTYGASGEDNAFKVIRTGGGGYAFAGSTDASGAEQLNFWLVIVDSNGNPVHPERAYGGAHMDIATALIQTDDGGYALTGYTGSFGEHGVNDADFWLVKVESDGSLAWNRTYGASGRDIAYDVVQTDEGGYALMGKSDTLGLWLVKTDAAGTMIWNRSCGEISSVWCDMVRTSDLGYALTCGSKSGDFLLVKTDSEGVIPEYPSVLILLPAAFLMLLVPVLYRKELLKQSARALKLAPERRLK